MRAIALFKILSVGDIRRKLVENISLTIQAFALLGLIMSSATTLVAPQMKITTEFCMLGACLVCAIVYLANELRYEAGTSMWFGAITSALIAADHLKDPIMELLMLAFAFICLWLMRYVTPHSKDPSS